MLSYITGCVKIYIFQIKFPNLYRLLANHETAEKDLTAKNPSSTRSVGDHVANGSSSYSSKFISTCAYQIHAEKLRRLKSRSRRYRHGTKDIVKIDVRRLPVHVEIIDLTTEELRKQHEDGLDEHTKKKFHKYAEEFSEVLLVGTIPSLCLKLID